MVAVIRPLTALVIMLSPAARAQYTALATPADGSVVYFISPLRLRSTVEPLHNKVFAADESSVRLLRSREEIDPVPNGIDCIKGPYFNYKSIEVSGANHILAASMDQSSAGFCHNQLSPATEVSPVPAIRPSRAQRPTPPVAREVPGTVRISRNGRYAVQLDVATSYNIITGARFFDLQTGAATSITTSSMIGNDAASVGSPVIADDGTFAFTVEGKLYTVRPGRDPQPLNVDTTGVVGIDAAATRVFYMTPDYALAFVNLRTAATTMLAPPGNYSSLGISDDGLRVLYLIQNQAWILAAGGGTPQQISNDPKGITVATLSGNGKIAYLATGSGRLLKLTVDTGAQTELMGRTPYGHGVYTQSFPGAFLTIPGSGLTDGTSLTASAPLPDSLGGISVTMNGRPVPMLSIAPDAIRVMQPSDLANGVSVFVRLNTSGDHSPFESPEFSFIAKAMPQAAYPLYHEDWTPAGGVQVKSGEIFHVLAVSLGPVTPEVPDGTLAPSSEPFARLSTTLTCTNAEVLYAGLRPGTLERVYQVDMRISGTGPVSSYCSPAGLAISVQVKP